MDRINNITGGAGSPQRTAPQNSGTQTIRDRHSAPTTHNTDYISNPNQSPHVTPVSTTTIWFQVYQHPNNKERALTALENYFLSDDPKKQSTGNDILTELLKGDPNGVDIFKRVAARLTPETAHRLSNSVKKLFYFNEEKGHSLLKSLAASENTSVQYVAISSLTDMLTYNLDMFQDFCTIYETDSKTRKAFHEALMLSAMESPEFKTHLLGSSNLIHKNIAKIVDAGQGKSGGMKQHLAAISVAMLEHTLKSKPKKTTETLKSLAESDNPMQQLAATDRTANLILTDYHTGMTVLEALLNSETQESKRMAIITVSGVILLNKEVGKAVLDNYIDSDNPKKKLFAKLALKLSIENSAHTNENGNQILAEYINSRQSIYVEFANSVVATLSSEKEPAKK